MTVNHQSDPSADLLSGVHQDPRPGQPPPGLTQFLDAVTPAGATKVVRAGLLVAAGAFVLAYGLYWWQFHREGLSNQQDVWGQFGDFIGGTVNPALSFLSLGALVFTVWLQMRQLELSRAALLATQQEMRVQADCAISAALFQALATNLAVTEDTIKRLNAGAQLQGKQREQQQAEFKQRDKLRLEIKGLTEHLGKLKHQWPGRIPDH